MYVRASNRVTPCLLIALLCTQATAQSIRGAAHEIDSVRIESRGQNFTPRQSVTPGGNPRHTSDFELSVTWEPDEWKAREEWALHSIYPAVAQYSFSMTYTEESGLTVGREGRAVVPDTRPMGASRIGANFKQLWLTNPLILAAHADVIHESEVTVLGKRQRQQVLVMRGTRWTLLLDQDSLPAELKTTERDQWGQTQHRVTFEDWREVSGVPFPWRIEQYLNGKLYKREIRNDIVLNPGAVEEVAELPELEPVDESFRELGWSMSHFFHARAGLAGPQDYFDRFSVSFHQVGDDLFHITGSEGHHNLLIVGPDGLAIIDAPWFDLRSEEVLGQLAERWPDKPLKYVILTHHHIDHTGGFMAYVRAGATLVTHQGNADFFAQALRAAGLASTSIVAVERSAALDDIGRRIETYDVINSHADATLMAYIPDSKLGYATDIFSPGREWQLPSAVSELVTAVRHHGIDVERFIGGHGSGAEDPTERL